MSELHSLLEKAFRENSILAAVLSVIADGGKVFFSGPKIEQLLDQSPGALPAEKIYLENLQALSDYDEKDLLLVEESSLEFLLLLNQSTGAQVALMSSLAPEKSLVDWLFSEEDLCLALQSLPDLLPKVRQLKGQFHLDGPPVNKALFLDRDGVIIEDTNYVNDPEKVILCEGVIEGLKKARSLGYFLIVVTNQAGIGKGFISWSQYEQVNHRMQHLLASQGVFLDRVIKAPFFHESLDVGCLVRRSLRKPRPGMLHASAQEFRIQLSESLLVGDSATDLMAGAMAGLKEVFLLESPKYSTELEKWKAWPLRTQCRTAFSKEKLKTLSDLFD